MSLSKLKNSTRLLQYQTRSWWRIKRLHVEPKTRLRSEPPPSIHHPAEFLVIRINNF